jgi:invasion protein IalB
VEVFGVQVNQQSDVESEDYNGWQINCDNEEEERAEREVLDLIQVESETEDEVGQIVGL